MTFKFVMSRCEWIRAYRAFAEDIIHTSLLHSKPLKTNSSDETNSNIAS